MALLNLTIKKHWFDLIRCGDKLEEYREIKDYWARRLLVLNREIEAGAFEEMIEDMNNPYRQHNGPEELMKYFGVRFREFDQILFRNGYRKDSPFLRVRLVGIEINTGLSAWGAEEGKYYFVLNIGEAVKVEV
jgi:hypothetical protein